MTFSDVTDYNGRSGAATGAFTRDEGALSDQDQIFIYTYVNSIKTPAGVSIKPSQQNIPNPSCTRQQYSDTI